MRRATVRHRLEYAAYRLITGGLRPASPPAVRRLGRRLGRWVHRFARRRRELALANLAYAMPELGPAERAQVARACFEHFGATFVEIALAAQLTPEAVAARFDVEGWEHVEAAEAQGRGLLMFSGHFGSWELAAYPLGLRFGDFHLVARPPNNPFVERDLRRVRERFGNRLLDKRGAGHRMLTVLRRRGRLGVVIDQRVRESQGIRVPFLGRPAWSSPVPAYLSIYTGAPAVPMFCYPAAGGRYRLRCDPAIEPAGLEVGDEGEAVLTRRFLAAVEDEIRRRPELWLWMHRRWEA